MIDYYQEIDSKVIFALSDKPPYSFPIEPADQTTGGSVYVYPAPRPAPSASPSADETIGGSLYAYFSPLPEYPNLVGRAWDTIHQTENQEVSKEARRLLSIIQEMIKSFEQFGFDLGHLPPLQAFNVDDGSVLIEWIFSDFRIGFTVESNPEDSGWYLISSKNLGEISASGYTSNMDIKALALWLLNFALSNS